MNREGKKDRQPWSPRLESPPLFFNSAEYERSLGETGRVLDAGLASEVPEEAGEQVPAVEPGQVIGP